jgi:tetratricopeptide (TPR) repeat protein
MSRICAVPSTVLLVLGAFTLSGCYESATNETGAVSTDTAPTNPKERLFAEQWNEATQGIVFDTARGVVEVDRLASGTSRTADEQLAAADGLFEGNRVVEAMGRYVLAARHDPARVEAYLGMGLVLARKGKDEEAIVAFRTAVDRDPEHLDARYRLANSLWAVSRQEDAIHEMNLLVTIDDLHARAHERLAVWQYYTGDYDAAWRHLHRAEELGQAVPGQLVPLLEKQMPDPGRRN